MRLLSRRLFQSILWVTLLAVGLSNLSSAQTSAGAVTGQVLDSTNAAVAGATVRITNTATNDARATATNNEGIYSLPSLLPGQCRIVVEKEGFSRSEVGSVAVNTAQAGYPIWLRLGNTGYWFSQGGGDALLQTSTLRPNLVPGVPLINPDWRQDPYRSQFVGGYLNPAAFAVPGSLDNPAYGNAPRTLPGARNPNTYFFDASISKRVPIKSERLWLQLRADFINALNHPNFFFNPNSGYDLLTGNFNRNSLTSPSIAPFSSNGGFGRLDPNNTNNGRTIRVAIQLGF